MVIAYVHQYFRTPDQGGCTRSYHLAKGLVAAGHTVKIITARNERYEVQNIEGIRVHYLPVKYRNEFGFFRRIFSFIRFVRLAKKELTKLPKIDLAYVMTTPLTTGLIGLHLKRKRGVPYFFEVGDLWPEAPIQMEIIKSRMIKSLLYRFEEKCYSEANKVIALSPDIRNYIEKRSPSSRVYVIPNISHCDYFQPEVSLKKFSRKNPFNIGYIGTLGKANGLEALVNVARLCEKNKLPVQFHIMGSGAERHSLTEAMGSLSNVRYYDFGPKQKVKALLETMDGVYVSFKNVPVLATGSPNKLFDGLAAGKLIITNFKGWTKSIIENNHCGFTHSPKKPEEFIEKLKPYFDDPNRLLVAQQNARRLAEQFYDKQLLVGKLLNVIENHQSMTIDDSEIFILTG
ncbi:glycosyltransferase family 4 protein [Marinoscillum sp. MHG1-6]|uniref:glycosyltransferase family 4 protein n=1 Tax=Marinoscillum sp. MHG1-6 TaxID=2959627 RepID=UPI00215847B3|nr:glycosyltransferase family 4 protein [Marinoscillum sp. MHG1-6]